MFSRCVRTVVRERTRRTAISPFVRPSATRPSTSASRSVSKESRRRRSQRFRISRRCGCRSSSSERSRSSKSRSRGPRTGKKPRSVPVGADNQNFSSCSIPAGRITSQYHGLHLAANDYARAWTSLDPRQLLRVDQRAYVRCESASSIPGRLDRIEVLGAPPERVVVPGSGGRRTRSTVITFRLTFAPRPSQSPVVVRVRAHALRSRGHWAWMLPAKRLALHRSGWCGSSPPHTYPDV